MKPSSINAVPYTEPEFTQSGVFVPSSFSGALSDTSGSSAHFSDSASSESRTPGAIMQPQSSPLGVYRGYRRRASEVDDDERRLGDSQCSD